MFIIVNDKYVNLISKVDLVFMTIDLGAIKTYCSPLFTRRFGFCAVVDSEVLVLPHIPHILESMVVELQSE